VHPILLHIGNIYLPTFGVLAAAGLLCALLLSERAAKLADLDPTKLWNAGLFAVIAAFVFSRAILVTQHWRSFVQFPILLLAVPSLTAPGLLLTLIATFLWLRSRQIPLRSALDAWAPCATLAWAFLALGHFAEGSDPGLALHSGWRHPVALYSAAFAALLTIVAYLRLRHRERPGELAAAALMSAGLGQFFLCFVRTPGVQLLGMDALEWVALAMVLAGGLLWLTNRSRNANVQAKSELGGPEEPPNL
jgi:phosphatidylglycerol:prolipoprotein diacylglycerol transferase